MFNEELLLSQIPDESTLKTGKGLAQASKWETKFAHELVLWGTCKGSGATPYLTQIDVQNLAFKCSCPSRKFPCKHGVGLALLYLYEKNVFVNTNELDERVGEWIQKRKAKNTTVAPEEIQPNEPTKADEDKLKRADARLKQVDAGVLELKQWLEDLVRAGIMDIPSKVYEFTKQIKPRMVDAKAGGLAGMLKNLEEINFYQENWQIEFMRQIARINLVLDAYENYDNLPALLQRDIKSLIGFQTKKDEVLQTQAFGDQWVVLSREVEEEDKGLSSEWCWLWGVRSNRPALILNFFGGFGPPLIITHAAGTTIIGDLCFYPSTFPLRALFTLQNETTSFEEVQGFKNIAEFKKSQATLLNSYPFLEKIPVVLSNVRLHLDEKNAYIIDEDKTILKLANPKEKILALFAQTAGNKISIFGLFNNNTLHLKSAWLQKDFYEL